MQQEELDVAAGDEAGDVVVEEFVDAFQVPVSLHGHGKPGFVLWPRCVYDISRPASIIKAGR